MEYTFEAVRQPGNVHKKMIFVSDSDGNPVASQHEYGWLVTPAIGVTLSEDERIDISNQCTTIRQTTEWAAVPASWPAELE